MLRKLFPWGILVFIGVLVVGSRGPDTAIAQFGGDTRFLNSGALNGNGDYTPRNKMVFNGVDRGGSPDTLTGAPGDSLVSQPFRFFGADIAAIEFYSTNINNSDKMYAYVRGFGGGVSLSSWAKVDSVASAANRAFEITAASYDHYPSIQVKLQNATSAASTDSVSIGVSFVNVGFLTE